MEGLSEVFMVDIGTVKGDCCGSWGCLELVRVEMEG